MTKPPAEDLIATILEALDALYGFLRIIGITVFWTALFGLGTIRMLMHREWGYAAFCAVVVVGCVVFMSRALGGQRTATRDATSTTESSDNVQP